MKPSSVEYRRRLQRRAIALAHELLEMPASLREPRVRKLIQSDDELAREVLPLLEDVDELKEQFLGVPHEIPLDFEAFDFLDIDGHRIQGRCGDGGEGRVYVALRPADAEAGLLGRVAIKVLLRASASSFARRRFQVQAVFLGRLNHPGIARFHYPGIAHLGKQQIPYLVMEFVQGTDLRAWCADHELTIRQRIALLIQVARALQHAHSESVIHLDVKPSNILVTREEGSDRPVLVDFGVGGDLLADHDGVGQVGITVPYASPEQIRRYDANPSEEGFAQDDLPAIGSASDIFSLALVGWELLAGHHPLASEQEEDSKDPGGRRVAAAICSGEIPPLAIDDSFADEISSVFARALAVRPEHRYSSAEVFARELERTLEYRPVEARPPSPVRTFRLLRRRHRPLVELAVTILILILVGSGTAMWLAHEWRSESVRALAATGKERFKSAELLRERAYWSEAASAYRSVLDFQPSRKVEIELRLLEMDLAMLRHRTVLERIETLEELEKSEGLGLHLADYQLLRGIYAGGLGDDADEARQWIQRAVAQTDSTGQPTLVGERLELGLAYLAHDLTGYIDHLRRAVALDPHSYTSQRSLLIALVFQGDRVSIVDRLSRLTEIFPGDPIFRTVHDWLAEDARNAESSMLARLTHEVESRIAGEIYDCILRDERRLGTAAPDLGPPLPGLDAKSMGSLSVLLLGVSVEIELALAELSPELRERNLMSFALAPPLISIRDHLLQLGTALSAAALSDSLRGVFEALPPSLGDNLVTVLPIGVSYYFRGILADVSRDLSAARRDYRLAAELPSPVPIQRLARFRLLGIQRQILARGPDDEELFREVRSGIDLLLSGRDLPRYELIGLRRAAADIGDPRLLKEITARLER